MKRIPLFLLVAFLAHESFAQVLDEFDRSRSSVAAFFNYSEPGDVTMTVNVWGNVRYPGVYEVPTDTRLNRLFALAGGPDVQERSARERKTLTYRLVRGSQVIAFQTMEESLESLIEDVSLQDGDVLMVDVEIQQRFSWRDFIPVVNAIGVLALAFERIVAN